MRRDSALNDGLFSLMMSPRDLRDAGNDIFASIPTCSLLLYLLLSDDGVRFERVSAAGLVPSMMPVSY